ncbi:MAG: DNA polymerase III subunit beta [Bacteroidales bacterium]|nr:DNA polymerase III subunit beta [Bacteroidales bacterium]
MKFIINSQLFAKHLQALSGVLTTNNNVPIISCFHFHLDDKTLTVKATDMETTLMVTMELEEAKVENISEIAVPAKMLLDILKSLSDEPITFAVDEENYSIEIVSREGKYHLAGQNPESFPAMQDKGDTTKVVLPASVLVNAITKTTFAASNDDMRQQMSGIFCELTPEHTTFVATDAHKLVRYRRLDVVSDEAKSFIFPKKPINLVKNILSANKEECDVTMEYNQTNVFFSFGNMFVACRLVDGKYPDYERAIPRENPFRLTLDRASFLNSLRRVSIFANQTTHQVRIKTGGNEIIITAEDIDYSNDARERLSCEYEGEPMEIGFNAKFLIEMVSNLDTENILMQMSHPSRAGLLTPVVDDENSKEDILMLVMPVMLANS